MYSNISLFLTTGAITQEKVELVSNEDVFLEACKSGNLNVVDMFLKESQDIILKARTNENDSGLILAVENEHFELFNRLLDAGCCPLIPGSSGICPLEILENHLSNWKSRENKELFVEQCLQSLLKLFQYAAAPLAVNTVGVRLLNTLAELFENNLVTLETLNKLYLYDFPEIKLSQAINNEKTQLFSSALDNIKSFKLFLEACKTGDERSVQEYLSKLPDHIVEMKNKIGDTALLIACQYGRITIVLQLLKYNWDANQKGSLGYTALELLSGNLHRLSFTFPIKPLVTAQSTSPTKPTSGLKSELDEYIKCIKILIEQKANPNSFNDEKSTLLHVLIDIYNNNYIELSVFSDLFSLAEFEFDKVDKSGMLPFQKALYCHEFYQINKLAKIFIRHNAPIYSPDVSLSRSSIQKTSSILFSYKIFMRLKALHETHIANDFLFKTKFLSKKVRSSFQKYIKEFSEEALTHEEAKKLLPMEGRYLNLIKFSDVFIAKEKHDVKIIKIFAYAIEIGCVELLEFLMLDSPEVIDKVYESYTPLTRACHNKDYELVNKLIELGANITKKDSNKRNALQILLEHLKEQLSKKISYKEIEAILTSMKNLWHHGNAELFKTGGTIFTRLIIKAYLENIINYESIKKIILDKPNLITRQFEYGNKWELLKEILDIEEEPRKNCSVSALILSSEEFFVYDELCDKHTIGEKERILELIKSFDERCKEFLAKESCELAYQIVIEARKLKNEFDNINARKRKNGDLFDQLFRSPAIGVVAKVYDFSVEETLILFFEDEELLKIMQAQLNSLNFTTKATGNSLSISGVGSISMSPSQIENFGKKYYRTVKEAKEKKNLSIDQRNTFAAPPATPVNSTLTALSTSIQVSLPKKTKRIAVNPSKKKAEQEKVIGRLSEKRLLREQEKRNKAEKKQIIQAKAIKEIAPAPSITRPKPSPRAPFPTIIKTPPPQILLPISGEEGFTVLNRKKEKSEESQKIRPKKEKITLVKTDVKRFELAQKHFLECRELTVCLAAKKFKFSENLESKIYKKCFEYHFLKGIKCLVECDKNAFKALRLHHINTAKLFEIYDWLNLNFPSLEGVKLYKLAKRFALAKIPSILGNILDGKGVKKYDPLRLENFKLGSRDFESKLVENNDKKLLSEINKELEFLEEVFRPANNQICQKYPSSIRKSLCNLSYFADRLTPACSKFKQTAEMQQLIDWGKLAEKTSKPLDSEKIRIFFRSKEKPLSTLRTNLGIIRFEIGTKGKIWWF